MTDKKEVKQVKPAIDAEVVTKELQEFIKSKYSVAVPSQKLRGIVFETLKEAGIASKDDKYANYEHALNMLDTLNGAFDNVFEFKDVEHFTGNLMYAMRLGTRKPIEDIEKLAKEYKTKYISEDGKQIVIDAKTFDTDMVFLTTQIKKSMSETWKYIEQTQIKGVGMIISKILKYILDKK